MTPHITRALALTALTALAACSGGGASVPAGSAAGAPASGGTGTATLSITRFAPQLQNSAKQRRPNEISYGTNSLVVDATQTGAASVHTVFDLSGATIGGGLACSPDASGLYQTCTAQIRLPLGNDSVTVSTKGNRDGSGPTLGSATITVTIKESQDNPIALTLDGKVTSMLLAISDPAPQIGVATSFPLTVQLYDDSGAVLVAPQNYTTAVTISDGDTSGATALFTQLSQNSTQRYNGTPVASPAPSALAQSVNIPDRYTQPWLSYNGATSIAPFQITATYGTLTSRINVTPATQAARTAGTTRNTYTWPAGSARGYDPIYDPNGNLWVTIAGGKIASVNQTLYQVTATYPIPTPNRTLRAPVIGPDGAIWSTSATVTNGAVTAPYFVTRFDPVTHAFTDYPASDSVYHITTGPNGLIGAERAIGKIWQLAFTGGTPAAAPTEFAVAAPPVLDPSPVLAPLPTWVAPSADGNIWISQTSYSALNGTWLEKYSPAGTKLSEQPVHFNTGRILDAQAIDANGRIWFEDLSANEIVVFTPATGSSKTYIVPRLFGTEAVSELTRYLTLDANGNAFFVSYLDNRIGRIDKASGRIDLLMGPNGGNFYGTVISPNGLFVMMGITGTTPFVFTTNT